MSTETSSPEVALLERLPSTWSLLTEALATYRANLRAILGIGVLGFVLVLITQVVTFFLVFTSVSAVSGVAGESFAAFGVALFMLLEWWLGAIIMASMAHALLGNPFKDALRKGFRQSLSYLWFTVIANGLFLGFLSVLVGIPAAIIWVVFALIFGAHVTGALLATIYGVAAFLALLVLFAGWYSTALWVLIDGEARGVRAFILSARRSKGCLFSVASRVIIGSAVLMLGYVLLVLCGDVVTAPLAQMTRIFAQSAVSGAISYLLFIPLVLGLVRAVHERVRSRVSASVVETVSRKSLLGMLFFAWMGVIAVPVLFVFVLLSAHMIASSHVSAPSAIPTIATSTAQ